MHPIYLALADVSSRMGVQVCDDFEVLLPAMFPQCRVPTGTEHDRSGSPCVGIEIVIADKGTDSSPLAGPVAQQKGTAFPLTAAAVPQFS